MSVSLAYETTSTASAASSRTPSPRPIDQRWDRSRGIVFGTGKRPSSTDPLGNRISSAPFSTSTRQDAVIKLGSPSTRKSNDPKNNNDARSVPPPSLNPRNPPPINRPSPSRQPTQTTSSFKQSHKAMAGPALSRSEVEAVQQQNKEQTSLITELTEQRDELLREQAKLKEHITSLRSDKAELIEKSKADEQKARRDGERITTKRYESSIRNAEKAHQESTSKLVQRQAEKVSELERWFKNELDKNPEYTAIVKELREKEEKRVAERRDEQEEHQKSLDDLQMQSDLFVEKIAQAEKSERSSLEKLNERAMRARTDRSGYTTYRNLYDEYHESIHGVLDQLSKGQKDLQLAAEQWRKSEGNFKEWKTKDYKLFDHISKYKSKGKSLIEFLQESASEADSAQSVLKQLFASLHAELHQLKSLAHDSRQLTRALHFEEERTIYETTKIALRMTLTNSFFYQISECRQRMDKAEQMMKETEDPTAQAGLTKERDKWRDQRALIMKMSAVAEHLIEIQALEALLQDTTVEKIVYLETRESKKTTTRIVDQYRDIRDEPWPGTQQERQTQVKQFLGEESQARMVMVSLESSVRRHATIQLDTGELDEEVERQKADDMINDQIARQRQQLDDDFAMLIPALKKPSSRRKRIAQGVSPPDTTASLRSSLTKHTAASPSRPVPAVTPAPQLNQRKSVAKYHHHLRDLDKAKAAILDPVNGDEGKLDEAAKLKLKRVVDNEQHIRKRLSKLEKSKWASESPNPPNTEGKGQASESITHGQSTSNPPEAKRESRRSRLRIIRHKSTSVRKVGSAPTDGSPPAKGTLNISPTKPMQACHSSMAYQLPLSTESTTGVDIEAPMSWMELSEEAKMRSLSGLTAAHATDRVDGHAVSSHDCIDGSQSTCIATSSEQSPSQSDAQERKDPVTERQPDTATGESDTDMALTYHISAKDYRAAATASPNSSGAWWSHKLYKGEEGIPPKVLYCTNFEAAEDRAKLFLDEPVLGFDLEWEPKSSLARGTIKRNVSLIQIASENRIGLFQISLFKGDTAEDLMPPSLRKILESPDIIKTGVNVSGDMNRMKACLDVEMKGVIELSHLYRVVKFSADQPNLVSFKLVSLAEQVQNVLLLPLKKDDNRMSSWSRQLNTQQTDYAAADAYAGFHLYHKLEKQRKKMSPTPPRPAFFETFKPIILGNGDVVERSAARKGASSKRPAAELEAGEEEEEFFDAREELDTYELSTSDPPKSDSVDGVLQVTASAGAQAGVAYSTLPQVSSDSTSESEPATASNNESSITSEPLPSLSTSTTNTRPSTEATILADAWLATLNNPTSRPSTLRAYHLWHEQNLSLQSVASTLRDPPLQLTTVASYVLEAVKGDNLPYDTARVKEALNCLPKSVWGRYHKIVKRVERERGRDL